MMVDSNDAFTSLQRCDASVQILQAEIRDRILVLANEGKAKDVKFPFDEYFGFVKGWNAYKAQNERTKEWFRNVPETLDQVEVYWKKNQTWRQRAATDMQVPPPEVPEVPPVKPPPANDPSRKMPYQTEIMIGLGVAALYLVARMMGKV